ncbi:TonB-dependent receptor domain-containing protein [Pontixanthobacter aquaemixtae]|uniref:TonB-dependent receptor n=1 Tax=Pontixanthobacter aquaemixtae TaxID=1958940 RepID=A0A844ZSV4_9SPHN|nr:TonB-dependent receptor [Pontixanthobacter aquaemixtae]MXO90973.1 TonB-dependent receptor [Pontixanthobacter aquaemixtae]
MTKSKRLTGLLLLTSALTFPGAALAQDTETPESGAATLPDQEQAAEPEDEGFEDPDISIPGGEIVVTGRRNRDVMRASPQVVSVLSSEEIARTGEGDIAGALGRVTGLSVVGNGNVYVRGLGDRYSLALLNGLPLPSPQPLSRVVPLDIFPTNVIASSLVQKTYSANFPGEFGGGVINLTTRAIPEESFLKISAGISGDTETTFGNGLDYYGSDYDYFGFDDGTRDVPPALQAFFDSGLRISDQAVDQQAIVRQLGNPNLVVVQKVGEVRPNFSGGITGGTAFDIGSDSRLGIIATASVSNKLRTKVVSSQNPRSLDLQLDRDSRNFITDNRILSNAMLGFGLEAGDHKFRWTNLFIRDTLKQTGLGFGELIIDGDSTITQNTGWYERQLLDSQLVAELEFGDLGVDLRGGYAQTQREAPYEYEFVYVRTNQTNQDTGDIFINVLDRQRGSASVAFSQLKEDLYYGGIDLSYPLADWLTVTAGYAYTDTSRFSERRQFLIDGDNIPPGVGALRPDLLLGDAIIDFYGIGLTEPTQTDPAFQADLEIQAGYVKTTITPAFGLNIDAGVRYEDAKQSVATVQRFDVPFVSLANTSLNNDYFLPGATITWEIIDDLQARASISKTIARPQFRELIFQPYTDPDNQRQYIGNPALTDTELLNAEARIEYYFDRGNRLSVAGFYKDLDNPIEPYVSIGADTSFTTRFANAPGATLYGGEVELQLTKGLYDWGGWFDDKQLILVTNYTYTQSQLNVATGDTTRIFTAGVGALENDASLFFNDGDPLTGQSDHLLNVQFSLEDEAILQQFTILANYASKRVTRRGTAGLPDIVEDPGLSIDFVARQGVELFKVPLELKFEARNIFGRDNFEFLSNGTDRIEVNSFEVGQSFSFSISAEF